MLDAEPGEGMLRLPRFGPSIVTHSPPDAEA
jgi:hypothetical protein